MPRNYNPDYEHMIANADKGPFSMTFNGTVLDSVITNLVIEDVEGRDSLSSEVSELSYGRVDGSRFRYRRNESKDLTVHYMGSCPSFLATKFGMYCIGPGR